MKKESSFSITRDSKIFIYGAGMFGRENAECLRLSGFKIEGFIDQHADLIKKNINTCPVYTLKIFSMKFTCKDCIIIVCVHNALWHNEIAHTCKKLGLEKIIFLPTNNFYNQEVVSRLYDVYNACCISHDYTKLENIPYYGNLFNINYNYKKLIIREYNDDIVCIVDSHLIFSTPYNPAVDDNLKEHELIQFYSDIPLSCMEPHINLFRYFLGHQAYPDLYLKLYKAPHNTFDESTDADFLEDRRKLFELYQRELNFGMEYFRDAPVKISWNSRGYFNIIDGHHRAAFLYTKDIRYIPVQMKKKDFFLWYKLHDVTKLGDYILANGIEMIQAPVSNLAFYRLEIDSWTHITIDIFNKWLKHISIKGTVCIEIGKYQACFLRAAYRMGIINNYYYEIIFNHLELNNYLNELQHTSQIECIDSLNDIETITSADILVLGSCVSAFKDKSYEVILEELSKKSIHYIFFISENNIEYEKQFIGKYFSDSTYQVLWRSNNSLNKIEVGYFETAQVK